MSTVLRRVAAVPTPDGALVHAVVDGADDAPVTLVLAHGWTLAQAAWESTISAPTSASCSTSWLPPGRSCSAGTPWAA